jgi:hypothetical protein
MKRKQNKINKKKKIKLINIKSIRFAPEIEVELPISKDSQKLIERNRTLRGWWTDFDGSLENGLEIKPKDSNKLYYNEETLLQLKEILALLRVHRAKIGKTCGLHIHVNVKNLTDKQILEIIKEFVHKQRFFIKRFKIDKNRMESTCKLLPRENLTKLTEKQIHDFRTNTEDWSFSGYSYLDEKYMSLNASHLKKSDYGTLEFRLYTATLNYKELKDRIYFTLNFVKESLERE